MNLLYYRIFLIFLFTSIAQAQTTSIFYDPSEQMQIADVQQATFEPIESGYTNGLNQGIYWLKILPKENPQIFQLRNNRLRDVKAFYQNQEIKIEWDNQFPNLKVDTGSYTLLRIKIDKEAYFTFKIFDDKDFYKKAVEESIFTGLFYGFALMVFLLNISLYVNFKDLTFLLYSIFLFFIIAVFAYRDGFVDILGFSQKFKEFSEPSIHAVGGLAGAAFATMFLDLHKYYPSMVRSYYFLVIPFSLLVVLYHATDNYLYFLGIDILCLYIFATSWFSALLLYRSHRHAIIFRVSYFFMLIAATMFYLFPALQIDIFEIEQKHLKWSGYLEMIVITSAVVYRMKILRERQEKMRQEMQDYLREINYLSEELERSQKGENSLFVAYDLTAREAEILERIAKGETNKKIAEELFISVNTVKYHVKKIYEKLDVSSRKEAFQKATSIA